MFFKASCVNIIYVLLLWHNVSMLPNNKSHDKTKTKPRPIKCRTDLPQIMEDYVCLKKILRPSVDREGLCI